jgi:hypothetical protein
VALTFLIGHLADHQRAALDLLADLLELLSPFLLSSLARGLHPLILPWMATGHSCWAALCGLNTADLCRSIRLRGCMISLIAGGLTRSGEIRLVGARNLTGGNTTVR